MTGFIYHDLYLKHHTGTHFPESSERLIGIVDYLEKKNFFANLIKMTPETAALKWIEMIHAKAYINRVEAFCKKNSKYLDTPDNPISKDSFNTAVLAVGGVLTAVDAVIEGKVNNVFCAVRPPGHHALAEQSMGFCIFNNVAIAAKYVQERYGLLKVAIIDWDVHHGNGTQAAFYTDPSVYYISTHQYPFYPGTGSLSEIGRGVGEGSTLNIPLSKGSDDGKYIKVFKEIIEPQVMKFKPDFIFISAGFDAYVDDPLGGMSITKRGFKELSKIVINIAKKCSHGRLISVLEGGYCIKALGPIVEEHLSALLS